jgi:hypothetical protein
MLFKLVGMRGVSADEIGRDSIKKLIRENEKSAGADVTRENPADTEDVPGDPDERESGTVTENGFDNGQEDFINQTYTGAEVPA